MKIFCENNWRLKAVNRGGSRAAATSKMELEAVNYYHKALDVEVALDPPLVNYFR